MADAKSKIFVLVEGAKADVSLMDCPLGIYGFRAKYQIVLYCTNLYTLYRKMSEENAPADIDLLRLLKSRAYPRIVWRQNPMP